MVAGTALAKAGGRNVAKSVQELKEAVRGWER